MKKSRSKRKEIMFYESTLDIRKMDDFFKKGGIDFLNNTIFPAGDRILNNDPFVYFSSLERALSGFYRNIFKDENINHTQFFFLLMLINNEANDLKSINSFSYRMLFDRTTVTRNARCLKKHGYVDFIENRHNPKMKNVSGNIRKGKEIKVTQKGIELVKRLCSIYEKKMNDYKNCLFLKAAIHCKDMCIKKAVSNLEIK